MLRAMYLVVRLDIDVPDETTDEQWEDIKQDIQSEMDYNFEYDSENTDATIYGTQICGESETV